MARKPSQQQLFQELQDRYGREVADAFMAGVAELRRAADLQRVIAALAAGNIEAAIEALHLDATAYAKLLDALQRAYVAGGEASVEALPPLKDQTGASLVIRFDARNYRAEAWLRDHSSRLVTRIVEDQRTAVRQKLTAGMEAGANPRTTALEVVGRINRATGKREGGILGLTAAQEGYVRNAREQLTSGDPSAMKAYLERGRRDKRFDRSVAKAIREGQTLPAETVEKALRQYQNRLLALRGEMIGRTEAMTALHAAQHQALRQAVEEGKLAASAVRRVWRSAGDLRVRHTHIGLNGDAVGLEEPFRSPSGARMLYPGDTSFGAPASETIGCRCVVATRIDFLANL